MQEKYTYFNNLTLPFQLPTFQGHANASTLEMFNIFVLPLDLQGKAA